MSTTKTAVRADPAVSEWSNSPGEFHPEALTKLCVNLSIHTDLHS